MYYEAKLYTEPEIKFEVNEVPDAAAEGWTGVVGFYIGDENASGYKAYGKMRVSAIKKLKNGIVSQIKEHESRILSLKRILKAIKKQEL